MTKQANKPILRHIRCLRLRHVSSGCQACIEACPHTAIGLVDSQPLLYPSECTVCGLCSTSCPQEAIFIAPGDDAIFEKFKITLAKPVITFRCSHAKPNPEDINIECFGVLNPSLILLAKAIQNHSVAFIQGNCETCGKSLSCNPAKDLAAQCSSFAEWAGAKLEISVQQQAIEVDGRRRAFFRGFVERIPDTAVEEPPKDENDSETPAKQIPANHLRLLTALRLLKTEKALSSQPVGLHDYFQHPEINQKCTGCAFCISMCPTGALQARKEGEELVIGLNRGACTSCGLCRDVCYTGAVDLKSVNRCEDLYNADPVILFRNTVNSNLLDECWEDKIGKMFDVPIYRS